MTKDKALQNWFSGFGLPAYAETAVPKDAKFPWLTYQFAAGAFDEGEAGLTVNLWFHTTGEAGPNAKAQALSDAIGPGGAVLPCDGGYIWLKRGSPWCQSLTDEGDRRVKRRYINMTAEFLTEN